VLSEDDHERQKHDDLIRRFLSKGNQAYRLRTLMTMMTYPHGEDVITLYAEGYSVVRFLVDSAVSKHSSTSWQMAFNLNWGGIGHCKTLRSQEHRTIRASLAQMDAFMELCAGTIE